MSGYITDSRIEQLGPVPTVAEVILPEVVLNHLRVARNKDVDPILRARAVKELQRHKALPEVDAFFTRLAEIEASIVAKRKIQALKRRPIK